MNDYFYCCNKPLIQPHLYYKRRCEGYVMELEARSRTHMWGMHHACDLVAREMYVQMTGKRLNVTSLINTMDEADCLFEYFKTYANVWSHYITSV